MLRLLLVPVLLLAGSCGNVNDTPFGGPYGGTTELTPVADADVDVLPE